MATAPLSRRSAAVLGWFGCGVIVIGGYALARTSWWFVLDAGLIPRGDGDARLVRPGVALSVPATALLAVTLGVCLLVLRRRTRPWVVFVLAGLAALSAALASLAVQWYPRGTRATLVAFDSRTGEQLWKTSTPATELFGIRSETADYVEVDARIDHHGCDWDYVSLTVDRHSGRILAVDTLPTHYPGAALIPRRTQPKPNEFRFDQGRPPVVCTR